jgi:ubiquinone biosynthesis protein
MKKKRRVPLRKALRYPARLQEIARTLVKFGLSDWVKILKLDETFPFIRRMAGWKPDQPPDEERRWQLIRMSFEELGPTFLKLGQIISYRTDLLPLGLVRELSKLQDDVQPFPAREAKQIIESELGTSVEEAFLEFGEDPIASASIAQVHRAVLSNGSEVAIKVQRPGVERTIAVDLDLMAYLAQLAERYIRRIRPFAPGELVEEFRRAITRELDFNVERHHMERFKEIYEDHPHLYVPRAYRKYSTKRLLTMEYVEGTRLSEVQAGRSEAFDKSVIARTATDIVLEQIYIRGYFHADPHPGNILVLDDDRLCFLDFGIVGRLRPRQQEYLAESLLGTVNRDAGRVTQAVLGLTKQDRQSAGVDELEEAIYDLIDEYVEISLGDVDITQFMTHLLRLISDYGLRMPSDLLLVTKTLVAVEGLGLALTPDFDFLQIFEPFARRMLLRRYRPRKLLEESGELLQEYGSLLREFPLDARDILKMMKTGRLNLGFRVWGLTPIRRTLDNVSYRLMFGLILAALLVSSSLVLRSGVPPLWNGISVIGLGGFALSGLFTFGFLFIVIIQYLRR